jgi:CheY-like chemotaxis protein
MKAEHPDPLLLAPARRAFVAALRRALFHLYDPIALRKSPLLRVFGLDPAGGASILRQILEDAIGALEPAAGVSPQSDAWRTCRTLRHRYVEQFSQASVAANLGLSVRQLRRQERMALQTLADLLVEQRGLDLETAFSGGWAPGQAAPPDGISGDEPPEDGDDQAAAAASAAAADAGGTGRSTSMEQELSWVERSFPNSQVSVAELAQSALQTVKPMMEASGVSAACEVPDGLPPLQAQWVTARQTLLNLLIAAIRAVPGGTVRVSGGRDGAAAWLSVQPVGPARPDAAPSVSDDDNLSMARQLAALSGGRLEFSDALPPARFTARLTWPVVELLPVLAIDDNADALQLIQRCLSNSRYQFVGTPDPARMLGLAEQARPVAIVLDVMLPDVDGWELLGRLRENPRTAGIPVIVSTILPQEDLALTLGAAAFLRKPVTRERLLAALERAADPPAPPGPTPSATAPG